MKNKKFLFITSAIYALVVLAVGLITQSAEAVMCASVPLVVTDLDPSRAAFERIIETLKIINRIFGQQIIASEGTLRSEQLIKADSSVYNFQTVQQNMNNIQGFPLQQGVDQNDVFIAKDGCLYLDHRVAESSSVLLQSYVNPFQFTAANTNDVASLQAFYNGKLSYQVGSTVFIPGLNTARFNKIPRTQQSSANNYSEFDLRESQLRLAPYPVFSGKGTNKLTVEVAPYTGFDPAASSGQNVVTLFFTGLTLQNASGFVDYFISPSKLQDAVMAWDEGVKKTGKADFTLKGPGA